LRILGVMNEARNIELTRAQGIARQLLACSWRARFHRKEARSVASWPLAAVDWTSTLLVPLTRKALLKD
jgi:hypothetical protein